MNETNKEKGNTNNDARGTNKGREVKVEREGEKMMGNWIDDVALGTRNAWAQTERRRERKQCNQSIFGSSGASLFYSIECWANEKERRGGRKKKRNQPSHDSRRQWKKQQ
jgi:hypothetical protein